MKILVKLKPMDLNLESISSSFAKELQFSNDDIQLQVKYVNELLSSEKSVFKEFSSWKVPVSHYLYKILSEWIKSKDESQIITSKYENLKIIQYDPHTFKQIGFKSPSAVCGDGELVTGNITNSIYELNTEEFQKLVQHTHDLNRTFYESHELLFYTKLSEKRIENYLNQVVNNTEELQICFRILFHFERIYQNFQIREWIRTISFYLLKQMKDTRMLLFEALRTSDSGKWFYEILQIDSTDTFLSLLSFFFIPIQDEKGVVVLQEDDYHLYFQQFPFFKLLESNPSLDVIETMLYILNEGMKKFKEYSHFTKQISQSIIRIFQLIPISQRLLVKGFFTLKDSNFILEFPIDLLDEEYSKEVLKRIKEIRPSFRDLIMTQIAFKHENLSIEILKKLVISKSINSLNELCKKYTKLYSKVFEEDYETLQEMDLTKWIPSKLEMDFLISKEQFKVLIQLPFQDFSDDLIKSIVVGLKSHQNFIALLHKIKDIPPEEPIDLQMIADPIEIYLSLKFNKNGFEDKFFSQEKFDSLLPKNYAIWENIAIDLSMRDLNILKCSISLGNILDERHKIFSALLIKKGNKKSFEFFIKEIIQIKDWQKKDSCLYVLNEISKNLITKNDFYFQDLNFNDEVPYTMTSPGLFSYFMSYYPQDFIKNDSFKLVVSPDQKFLYFKLFYFIVLAKQQYKQRDTMFQLRVFDLKDYNVIYRVIAHCLYLTKEPFDKIHFLFWQLFLDLYFERDLGHFFLNIQSKQALDKEIIKVLTEKKLPMFQKILYHYQSEVPITKEPCFFTGTFWKEDEQRIAREKVFKDFAVSFPTPNLPQKQSKKFEFDSQMFPKYSLLKFHYQLRDLDEAYLTLVPSLYENRSETNSLRVPCIKGPLCRGPAIVTFSAPKKYFNINVEMLINQNREKANGLLRLDYSRKEYLEFLIDLEWEILTNKDSKFFYQLISLYEESPRIISHLLSLFNMELENESVFALMLNLPLKIPLLLKYYKPIKDWKRFLIPIAQKKGFPHMVTLLKTFEVSKDIEEKDKLLEHCFIMILEYYKRMNNLTTQEIDVYQYYYGLFFKLLEIEFLNLSNTSYYFIINGMTDKLIPPSLIEDYSKLPFQLLSLETLLEHIYSTREILWKKRRDLNQTFYLHMKEYIKPLINLITQLYLLMEANETLLFDSIQAIFELFIFPIHKNVYYGRSVNESDNYIQPVEEKLMMNNQILVLYEYVALTYKRLIEKKNIPLNLFFSYYYKNLYMNLAPNLLSLFKQHLVTLPWTLWNISNEDLPEILAVMKKDSTFMTKILRLTKYTILDQKLWIEIYLLSDHTVEWNVEFKTDELESIDSELKLFIALLKENKYASKTIQKINQLFLNTISKHFKSYVLFFNELITFTEKILNEKEILTYLLKNNLNHDYEEIFILLNRKSLVPIIHDHLNQNLNLSLKCLTVCRDPNTCELLLENYFKTEDPSWNNLQFMKDRNYLKTSCLQNGYLLTLYSIGIELNNDELIKWARNEKIILFLRKEKISKSFLEHLYNVSGLNDGLFSKITFGMFNESYSNEFKLFCKYFYFYMTQTFKYNEKDKIDQVVFQKINLSYPEYLSSLIQLFFGQLKYFE